MVDTILELVEVLPATAQRVRPGRAGAYIIGKTRGNGADEQDDRTEGGVPRMEPILNGPLEGRTMEERQVEAHINEVEVDQRAEEVIFWENVWSYMGDPVLCLCGAVNI